MSLFISFALFPAVAKAETPIVHTEVIDADGQISNPQWRTSSVWIWSQNRLRLQTVIEIPTHLAASLPEEVAENIRGETFRGPFKLQPDYQYLVLEMSSPVRMFKLGHESMRVVVDYETTNSMRTPSCREANVALEEVADEDAVTDQRPAFFISLACKPSRAGMWVQVEASEEANLSFEPKTRIRNSNGLTEFWIAPHKSGDLGDIIVSSADGDLISRYRLNAANSKTAAKRKEGRTEDPAEEIPVLVSPLAFHQVDEPPTRTIDPSVVGISGQMLEAHGARTDANGTGRSNAEMAVNVRVQRPFLKSMIDADLQMPIRRLGAGLDAQGAGSHFGWINAGYSAIDTGTARISLGAEASVLDVHSPERVSTLSLSPSAQFHFSPLYSVTLAPIDVISNLSVARARADIPITKDRKNRLTVEALLARTWIQPQRNSWNATGATLGFVGEF